MLTVSLFSVFCSFLVCPGSHSFCSQWTDSVSGFHERKRSFICTRLLYIVMFDANYRWQVRESSQTERYLQEPNIPEMLKASKFKLDGILRGYGGSLHTPVMTQIPPREVQIFGVERDSGPKFLSPPREVLIFSGWVGGVGVGGGVLYSRLMFLSPPSEVSILDGVWYSGPKFLSPPWKVPIWGEGVILVQNTWFWDFLHFSPTRSMRLCVEPKQVNCTKHEHETRYLVQQQRKVHIQECTLEVLVYNIF